MSEGNGMRPVMSDDREEMRVIRACAGGDWKEFGYIFNKHKDRVYFLALSVVKDGALAGDITQNSFIKVFKSLKWFDQRSRFSTWIFRIAYNQALDQYRRRKREGGPEAGGAEEAGGDPFSDIAGNELRGKLAQAVELLPLKLRTAVILRYVEGLTYREICQVMGCARGVLQKRLSRARDALKDILRLEISELKG